jgi:ABC-type branched-subunit amino acid transport system substrate-binding protein
LQRLACRRHRHDPASVAAEVPDYLGACEEINAKGGVNGRKLMLVSRDDEHNPVTCLETVLALFSDNKSPKW